MGSVFVVDLIIISRRFKNVLYRLIYETKKEMLYLVQNPYSAFYDIH